MRSLRLGGVVLLLVALLAGCTARPTAALTAPPTSQSVTADGARVEVGIPSATVDGVTLRLDACLPKGDSTHPGLVIVPGGGFTQRTRDFLRPECEDGAKRGYATFVVDYRLAGEGTGASTFPAQVQDVERAIRWVRAKPQAQHFALDPSNMVLLGESAGAIIAAEIAVGAPGATLPRSTFRGVALFSGLYDFGAPSLSEYLIGISRDYLGCVPSASCAATKTASADNYVKSDDPPMLLVNAKAELMPLEQLETFAATLTAAHVEHEVVLAPKYHALDIARKYAIVRSALWKFVRQRTSS